jgi:hypothetical protein
MKPTVQVDLSEHFKPAPFWMLTRWEGDNDLCEAEREEAAAAGVTDFDDAGFGLAFNRKEDADKVAVAMAARFSQPFGVYGPGEDGKDGVWLALPPRA